MTELNEMPQDFVANYVGGEIGVTGNGTKSAIAAGYSEQTAHVQACKMLKKPHIQAAIIDETRSTLSRLAPLAVGVVQSILKDDAMPPRTRLDAAKTLLDRIGVGPQLAAPDPHEGSVSRMSLQALAVSVSNGMKEKTKTIEIESTGDHLKDIALAIMKQQEDNQTTNDGGEE